MKRRELLMDFTMGVIDLLNSQNSNYNFKMLLSILWTFKEVKPHILICFLEVLPTHFRTRIITFSCEQFFKVQSKSLRGTYTIGTVNNFKSFGKFLWSNKLSSFSKRASQYYKEKSSLWSLILHQAYAWKKLITNDLGIFFLLYTSPSPLPSPA